MEPTAWFVVESGPEAGRQYPVSGGQATLGRSGQCEITLVDERASREHASVRWEGQGLGWIIADLGSTNGTFVNGHQLQPHVPHMLHTDDRVEVANTALRFQERGGDRDLANDSWIDLADTGTLPAQRGLHPVVVAMAATALLLFVILILLAILVLNASL